jgi:hypothetical protein
MKTYNVHIKCNDNEQIVKVTSDDIDVAIMYIKSQFESCEITKYEETIVQIYIDKWNLS